MESRFLCLWLVIPHVISIKLYCGKPDDFERKADIVADLMPHNFTTICPCAHDLTGHCRQKPHMCTATRHNTFCNFNMTNVIVASGGGMIDAETQETFYLTHPSIRGEQPIYFQVFHDRWSTSYTESARIFLAEKAELSSLPSYELVLPTRMRWDDCFNHLSFQLLPLLGHARALYHDIWSDIYWHASRYSAAILLLLDIPQSRILIEKNVLAKRLVLPWLKVYVEFPLPYP